MSSSGQDMPVAAGGPARRVGFDAMLALLAFTYMLLLGGTNVSELSPMFAGVSIAIAMPFVVAYIRTAPRDADRVDRLVLLAVVTFIAACALSILPRNSLEPAMAAIGYAAAFFVARRLFAAPGARRAMIWTLIALSTVMTALTAGRWVIYILEWLSLVEWQAAPPLNMELPSIPWGHRHDLALLVVMLYPAWWLGGPSPLRRLVAVLVGAVVAFVVLVDGSRTLWLAMAGAAVITAGLAVGSRRGVTVNRRVVALAVLVAVIGSVALLTTGIGATLVARLTNFESVGWRADMWSALWESWLAHPLAGSGPGTFPWLLQETGYFDTSSFAPRHPDSAPIQLLAEGGLVGIGALVVLLVAVVPPLVRSGSKAAIWVLVTFGLASLASNPTDFAFMVITAVAWTAFALPAAAGHRTTERQRHSPDAWARARLAATLTCAAVVALAWGATALAAGAYADARAALSTERFADALDHLDRAIALDPGMALYVRQRGTLQYILGKPARAGADLEAATRLNPRDDLAWRMLGLSADANGNETLAARAIDRSVAVQRSDPTNVLLSLRRAIDEANSPAALGIAAEVVHAWPQIIYASDWEALIGEASFDTDDVIAMAADRWRADATRPELVEDQGIWLSALDGATNVPDRAVAESDYSPQLARAAALLLRCEPASDLLRGVTSSDLQNQVYWQLRLRDAAIARSHDARAAQVIELMRRRLLPEPDEFLNPLRENSIRGTSSDLWGYRRPAMDWPAVDIVLPSPAGGMAAWSAGQDCD